jgi:hypothetical protein
MGLMKYLFVPLAFTTGLTAITLVAKAYNWPCLADSEFIVFVSGFTTFFYVNYLFSVKWKSKNEFKNYRAFAAFDLTTFEVIFREFATFFCSVSSGLLIIPSFVFLSIFTNHPFYLLLFCVVTHYAFSLTLVIFIRVLLASLDWNYFVGLIFLVSWFSIINTFLVSSSVTQIIAQYNLFNSVFYLPLKRGVFNLIFPTCIYVGLWIFIYFKSKNIKVV